MDETLMSPYSSPPNTTTTTTQSERNLKDAQVPSAVTVRAKGLAHVPWGQVQKLPFQMEC